MVPTAGGDGRDRKVITSQKARRPLEPTSDDIGTEAFVPVSAEETRDVVRMNADVPRQAITGDVFVQMLVDERAKCAPFQHAAIYWARRPVYLLVCFADDGLRHGCDAGQVAALFAEVFDAAPSV